MLALISRFAPSLIPGLGAMLNPWVIIAFLVMISGAYLAGYREAGIHQKAADNSAVNKALVDAAKFIGRQQVENAALSNRLAHEKKERDNDQRDFEAMLARTPPGALVNVDCPQQTGATQDQSSASGAAPAHVQLSVDGVRLWNKALSLGVVDAERGRFADAANSGSGPVEIADAIQNVAENAAILGECRARESAWQRKACDNGMWKGAPCNGF